jgi:uncharacterized Zn ribbon protein
LKAVHLSKEEREKVARNAAAAAERMKERGDKVTVVQDIRRRNAGRVAKESRK